MNYYYITIYERNGDDKYTHNDLIRSESTLNIEDTKLSYIQDFSNTDSTIEDLDNGDFEVNCGEKIISVVIKEIIKEEYDLLVSAIALETQIMTRVD